MEFATLLPVTRFNVGKDFSVIALEISKIYFAYLCCSFLIVFNFNPRKFQALINLVTLNQETSPLKGQL